MSIIEDAKDKDMFSAEYCRDGRRRIELKEGLPGAPMKLEQY